MNIITIDPSLSCTAVCINGDFYIYVNESLALNKKGGYKKWFELANDLDNVLIRAYYPPPKNVSHNESEVNKLMFYASISDGIMDDIRDNTLPEKETIVVIEGYSHNSVNRSILDLVALGTLIRNKILFDLSIIPVIITPLTLKMRSCELVYGENFNSKGKQIPCINNQGTSGGRFKKPEMLQSLLDCDTLENDKYINFLKDIKDEFGVNIPKPIEDMNDVKLSYEITKYLLDQNNYNIYNTVKSLLK